MNLQSHIPWQDEKSLAEAASHLCMKATLSDVKFTFPEEANAEPVPAHKFILAMRSSEFENKFYNQSISPGTVAIKETKREMFLKFLRFLYTDEVALSNNNVTSILHLSYKYQVTTLTNLCQKHLHENLSPHTASSILQISEIYNMTLLKKRSLEYIEQNTSTVLLADDWLSLSLENLKLVLSRDRLSAAEKEIFVAVMRWASEECKRRGTNDTGPNRRAVLGDVVYQIRIPTLSLEDYSQVVIKSGILTDSEQLDIFKYLTSASDESIQHFVTKTRIGQQIIIELKNMGRSAVGGSNLLRQLLNLTITLQSNKVMNSMVVDLTNTKTGCQSSGYRCAKRHVGTISPEDCVLKIANNTMNRETNITGINEVFTVDIEPPICLNSRVNNVQVSLWRRNCSECRQSICPIIGENMNGYTQNKDIRVSYNGVDLVKSVTFT